MKGRRLVWELLGAAVGAGLASGREIAAFFSQHGMWSWAGVMLSAVSMGLLLPAVLPDRWEGGLFGRAWRLLEKLLLILTGGAMLSGAGEVAALTLPVRGAYWLGLAGTLLLGWLLAHRTQRGLAWVSRALLAAMALLLVNGMLLPPMQAVRLEERSPAEALLRGLAYGGFNAALMRPVMRAAAKRSSCTGWIACLSFGLLLAAGNAVLLRHGALLTEPMPFVRLAGRLGRMGYILSAACMYLAVLSTLIACLRGIGRSPLPCGVLLLSALAGFSGMIGVAYPLLGLLCMLMMGCMRLAEGASNFRNSSRKAFQFKSGVL